MRNLSTASYVTTYLSQCVALESKNGAEGTFKADAATAGGCPLSLLKILLLPLPPQVSLYLVDLLLEVHSDGLGYPIAAVSLLAVVVWLATTSGSSCWRLGPSRGKTRRLAHRHQVTPEPKQGSDLPEFAISLHIANHPEQRTRGFFVIPPRSGGRLALLPQRTFDPAIETSTLTSERK